MLNKKALSNVVVVVLLILLVIIVILLLWQVVFPILTEEEVDPSILKTRLNIESKTICFDPRTNPERVELSIRRTAGKGNLVGVLFIFENASSAYAHMDDSVIIKENEEKRFVISLKDETTGEHYIENLEKITVYPLIMTNKGKEAYGSIKAVYKVTGLELPCETLPGPAEPLPPPPPVSPACESVEVGGECCPVSCPGNELDGSCDSGKNCCSDCPFSIAIVFPEKENKEFENPSTIPLQLMIGVNRAASSCSYVIKDMDKKKIAESNMGLCSSALCGIVAGGGYVQVYQSLVTLDMDSGQYTVTFSCTSQDPIKQASASRNFRVKSDEPVEISEKCKILDEKNDYKLTEDKEIAYNDLLCEDGGTGCTGTRACFWIKEDEIVFDMNEHTITYTEPSNTNIVAVYIAGANNSLIKNGKIERFGRGIVINRALDNEIRNNNISQNSNNGVYILYSNKNLISDNILESNSNNGIRLQLSSDNQVINNTLRGNDRGISIIASTAGNSNNNRIINNTINPNSYGIELSGSGTATTARDNLVKNNTITGSFRYGIYVYAAPNIIRDNDVIRDSISGDTYGIYLTGIQNEGNLVFNNSVYNLGNGVFIGSNKNKIKELYASDNNAGIHIASDENLIENFSIYNSFTASDYDGAIVLNGGNNNRFKNGIIDRSNRYGILLYAMITEDSLGRTRYYNNNNNLFESIEIGNVANMDISLETESASVKNENNRFISVTCERESLSEACENEGLIGDGVNELKRGWYLDVHVTQYTFAEGYLPAKNANVILTNNPRQEEFSVFTGENGRIETQDGLQYMRTNTGITLYDPHTLQISKNPFNDALDADFKMSRDKRMEVRLNSGSSPSTIEEEF